MPKKVTMSAGERFGLLTIVREARRYATDTEIRWLCRCDCGRMMTAIGSKIRSGHTRSCGCLREEARRHLSHGWTGAPEYTTWTGMRGRCMNPRDAAYPNYGGRGIAICAAWDTFQQFLADMGPRPSRAHSLDRIDNDGPYSPENCRWATATQQARNRRVVTRYESHGLALTTPEWAELTGIPYKTLSARIRKWGWADGRALAYTGRVPVVCDGCGGTFRVVVSSAGRRKCCSRTCRTIAARRT